MPKTYQNPRYPYRRSPDQDAVKSGAGAHHPIIVVGAGLVGLTAAVDLASRGVRSVVQQDPNDLGSHIGCGPS